MTVWELGFNRVAIRQSLIPWDMSPEYTWAQIFCLLTQCQTWALCFLVVDLELGLMGGKLEEEEAAAAVWDAEV